MEIKKEIIDDENLKTLYKDPANLIFGKVFTDYMFTLNYTAEKGWFNPTIKPYSPFQLDPAALVLHYSQEVFEGLKAYLTPDDEILIFRPWENARRFNRSLERICMPRIPEEHFIYYLKELVKLEKRWIPSKKGTSLYIRPAAIATEAKLGMKPAEEYLFFIILAPVGPYFKTGFKPGSLWVSKTYSRAAPGGTGTAKTGGNYSGSLYATKIAIDKGYNQVLWLDAGEHRYIEEVGAMNIFFVINKTLVTPSLTGTILEGITRKSIIQLAKDSGIPCEERKISLSELKQGIKSGAVSEVFGAGTAAVISPVGKLNIDGEDYIINNNETGHFSQKFFDQLTSIQYGETEDIHNWMFKVE